MQKIIMLIGSLAIVGFASIATLAQNRAFVVLDEAPLDRAVDFRRARLEELFGEMSRDDIVTMRLLEGGDYNVNIRHVENVTPENFRTLVHPDTIDVEEYESPSQVTKSRGARMCRTVATGTRYTSRPVPGSGASSPARPCHPSKTEARRLSIRALLALSAISASPSQQARELVCGYYLCANLARGDDT